MPTNATVHQTPQEYQFPYPALDLHANPVMIPPGPVPVFSKLVGVDGRYVGELRRFPGFHHDADWTIPLDGQVRRFTYRDPATNSVVNSTVDVDSGVSAKGVSLFRYAAVQKDVKSDDILRGWLTLAVINTGSNTDALIYTYYDTADATWHKDVVAEFTDPSELQIAGIVTDAGSTTQVEGDPGMWITNAATLFAGGEVDLWDVSTGTLVTRAFSSYSDGNTYPEFNVGSSFGVSPAAGDHVRVRPASVSRFVDTLDVAAHQRHFYLVGMKSDISNANPLKIERQVRFQSNPAGTRFTINSANANTGPFAATALSSGFPLTGYTFHNSHTGWRMTVNTGSGLTHAVVKRSLGALEGAVVGPFSNSLYWDTTYTASQIQGQTAGFQEQPWLSAPMRPGLWIDDTTKRSASLPETDLQILTVTNATHQVTAKVGAVNANSGVLSAGQSVTVALRFVAPEQNWYSSLSNLETVTVNASFVNATIRSSQINTSFVTYSGSSAVHEPVTWPLKWAAFPTRRIIQLWRSTVNAVVPGTSTPSGLMFLEKEIEWEGAYLLAGSDSQLVWGTKTDAELILAGDSIDQNEVAILKKTPPARFVELYDDLMFQVSIPEDDDDAVDLDVLRWSPTDKERLNYCPVANRRIPATLASRIIGLKNTGQFLVVLLDNQILRIQRSGEVISVDTIHNEHGVVGEKGFLAIGNTLYLVSPVGLLVVDLNTGDLQNYQSVQRKFTEQWKNSLDDVRLAYDALFGCLCCLNPTTKEMLLVWMGEGVATELEWIPFTDCTTGPDPETGGQNRAWFYQSTSATIYTLNNGESNTESLVGNSGDLTNAPFNIPAGSVTFSATTVGISAAVSTLYPNVVGFPVVAINTVDPTQTSLGYVTSRTGTFAQTWQIAGGWSNGTPVNTTWSLSVAPISYHVRLPMVSGDAASSVLTLWQGKKVMSMSACIQRWTAGVGDPNAQLVYRVVGKDLNTVYAQNWAAMSDEPDETWSGVLCQGSTMFPEVLQYASDCPFSLTGVLVERTIESH